VPEGRILVVDDDPDVSLVARLHLEMAGFQVVEAPTIEEALAHAEADAPDLVLLDWMLPDGDGVDVIHQLAGAGPEPAAVVMLTARGGAADQRRAWEAGVAGYLTKPFDGADLVASVRDLLSEPVEARAERRRAALEALDVRRSRPHDRTSAIVEDAADAIVTTSLDGVVLSWNRAAEVLFGHPASDVVGRSVSVLAADRTDELPDALELVASGAPAVHIETVRRRRDGSEVAVSVAVSPVRDRDGHITAAALVARDVTDRKATESLHRGLLEAAPDAMVVVDRSGRIVLVNAQTEALFGWAREDLVGQDIEVLVPDELRGVHPGHRDGYFAEPRTRSMGQGLDLVARRQDGSTFPAEISLSSIETERGPLVSAAIRDVSERKAAEARFRGLVDSAPDAMVIVDGDGRIELVNHQAEAMFGYGRGELLGRPVEVLVPPRFRDQHPGHRRTYTGAPRVRPMGAGLELFALRKDGSEFPVEISLSPLETATGISISAAIRDVTARKRAEAVQAAAFEAEREAARRLREVDRLRSDFLSMVSHELRTPLTAIRGFADLLVAGWDSMAPEQRFQLVERIAAAGVRLDRLIEDLLDLTRLERGQLALELQAVEVEALVEDVLRQLVVPLEAHVVELDVQPGLVAIVDPGATTRVVSNLLTNAAKFSPPGTTIAIRGHREHDKVVLSVRDEGPGIPEHEHEQVFERFHRGAGSAHRPGTGVGLAIVKELTEAQGGQVALESAEGEGSELTLRFRAARS